MVGWEGLYEVSSLGRVRTLPRHGRSGRILKLQEAKRGGYPAVSMSRNSIGRTFKVHVLVARAFLGPKPDGMEVLHADDDKTNNAVTNLRYGTRSENLDDRVRNGIHHNSAKTHCIHGHEYTPENTVTIKKANGRTQRACRACRNV